MHVSKKKNIITSRSSNEMFSLEIIHLLKNLKCIYQEENSEI